MAEKVEPGAAFRGLDHVRELQRAIGERLFRRKWGEKYAPFAEIEPPQAFPPEIIGDGQDRNSIPLVNPGFAARARGLAESSEQTQVSRVIVTAITRNQFVYPMEITDNHEAHQIISLLSMKDFEERFGFQLTLEEIRLLRTYYQVDAMIAGGSDLLFAARMLEAKLILEKNPSLDPKLVSGSFGLHISPSEYFANARIIESYIESGSINELRDLMLQDPTWFTVFMTEQIAEFIQNRALAPGRLGIDWCQKAIDCLTAANIGVPEERLDQIFLHPAIGDAISFMKDLVMQYKYPHVFAMANAAINEKFAVPYYLRFNSPHLTRMFNIALIRHGFVTEGDITEGGAVTRANIRPANAVALDYTENESEQKRVSELAKRAGIEMELPRKGENASAWTTLELVNKLVDQALSRQLKGADYGEISRLVDGFAARARSRFDIVRCRLNLQSPEGLNQAVSLARRIVEKDMGSLIKVIRGRQIELYLNKFIYSLSEKLRREKMSGEEFPDDPALEIAQTILSLIPGQLAHVAYHFHGPIKIGEAIREGKRRPNISFVEIRMGLRCFEQMSRLVEPVYKGRGKKTLAAAGFTLDQVEAVRLNAQQNTEAILRKLKGSP
jgi:hypothetical protein